MASTPDLSSPSSSSDDDHPLFTALSTSAVYFSQLAQHTPPDPGKDTESLLSESGAYQSLIYHIPPYSSLTNPSDVPARLSIISPKACSSPLQSHLQPDQAHQRGVHQVEPTLADPKVAVSLLPLTSIGPRKSSDSLPDPLHKRIYRHNQPSFIKFPDTLPLNKPQLHGLRSPHPRRVSNSIGTEALISLAWTGEVPSPIIFSGYVPSSIGTTYMWPKLGILDTEVTLHQPGEREDFYIDATDIPKAACPPNLTPNSSHHHPWTLASVISDDFLTDENLVELLEQLRLRGLRSTHRTTSRFLPDLPDFPISVDEPPILTRPATADGDNFPPSDLTSQDMCNVWFTTRRALLVCRELICTERHYLLSLNILAEGQTQPVPPSSMIARLPALIDASTLFLNMMEKNPSVLGVCTAFVAAYDSLEAAMVQWCEVVGEFFTTSGHNTPVKRSNSAPVPDSTTDQLGSTTLTRRVGSWSRKMHYKGSINIDDITSIVTRSQRSKLVQKPKVRDLAILPTQRITRYVLLFKDLFVHTPLSMDFRPKIERAANATMSLAQKADRAQDHSAFRISSPI